MKLVPSLHREATTSTIHAVTNSTAATEFNNTRHSFFNREQGAYDASNDTKQQQAEEEAEASKFSTETAPPQYGSRHCNMKQQRRQRHPQRQEEQHHVRTADLVLEQLMKEEDDQALDAITCSSLHNLLRFKRAHDMYEVYHHNNQQHQSERRQHPRQSPPASPTRRQQRQQQLSSMKTATTEAAVAPPSPTPPPTTTTARQGSPRPYRQHQQQPRLNIVNSFFCTHANILFADIVNFSHTTLDISCEDMLRWLQHMYGIADSLAIKYNVEINKMIGDCFMFTTGIMDVNSEKYAIHEEEEEDGRKSYSNEQNQATNDAVRTTQPTSTTSSKNEPYTAEELQNAELLDQEQRQRQQAAEEREKQVALQQLKDLACFACEFRARVAAEITYPNSNEAVSLRMGLHCGKVICGVMGTRQVLFDVWSNNVNIASRMESLGICGKIQCTEEVYEQLKQYTDCFHFEQRGNLMVRSIGNMRTFLL